METRNGKTDKMPINRVILMSCGRYNPPTYMHLRMFERARDHLHTLRSHTVLGGVISPVNDCCPEMNLEKSNIRTDLLTLALQNNDWIRLSSWEMKQNATKSIRDTLQHHQSVLNSFINNDVDNNINNEDLKWIPPRIKDNSDNSPVQIKLLCGVDFLESFATPGLWLEEDIFEILDRYGLVVMDIYGGNVISKFIYDSDILSKYMHNINVVTEWIPNEVNSTRIRRALRRGESVKYFLQDNVINSIYKHGFFCAVKNLA